MISGTLTKAGVKGLQGDLPGQVFYGIVGKDGEDGGYYTPAVTQPEQNKIQFDFTPSKADMPAVKPVQVELPAGQGSGGNAVQYVPQVLTPEQKAHARANIGAATVDDVIAALPVYNGEVESV